MSSTSPPRPVSAAAIYEWAALADLPIEDAAMAERIAAGAASAVAAVWAVQQALPTQGPPTHEPADYLACLERWAESTPPPTPEQRG